MLAPSPFLNGFVRLSFIGPALSVLTACTFHGAAVAPADGELTDGSSLATGPTIAHPPMNQVLSPTHAFLFWRDGEVPTSRTINGYEVCSTTDAAVPIDQDSQCPNSVVVPDHFTVLDPLIHDATYRWKVRARFDDGSNSPYGALQTFTTDNSLLAWWRLNEGTGNTAMDSGLGANNGTLQGSPAWVAGQSGQALQFNGSNFVLVGDQPTLEGMSRLSVETWLKTTTTGMTRHIVSKWSAVDRSFAIRTSSAGDGRLSFQTFTSGAVVLTSTDAFNNDAWHYVIGTYDGTSQQLYVDLMMQGASAQAGSIANSTSDMCLAESCNGGAGTGFGFDGTVDEAAIYNRDLSADDRTNSFCATSAAGGVDPLPAPCQ